jgi:uncharacterized protein
VPRADVMADHSGGPRPPSPPDAGADELHAGLQRFVGLDAAEPRVASDPVNAPMIRHWCEALDDRNSRYQGPDAVAPPAMLEVWTMTGRAQRWLPDDPFAQLMAELEGAGFTSVVATNTSQRYERELRPGDVITAHEVIADVSERKRTGLGDGHFVTTETTYTDQDGEVVGTRTFRILRFAPKPRPPAVERVPPSMSDDTRFFWEGCKRRELLIQRCAACGTLRHPPRPMCAKCRSLEWDTVRSSGRGTVFSFVVHHHPPIPGFEVPFVIALADLEEGTRLVANVDAEPGTVDIGTAVIVDFVDIDDEFGQPVWKVAT